MKRVLVVKTSSMGDVIHALPALTDAAQQLPALSFDWVVEEGFQEIPALHPEVDRVVPVAIRRWRKEIIRTLRGGELGAFLDQLRKEPYDLVIDAQGLLKSAIITRLVGMPSTGFDRGSVRERVASRFYDSSVSVPRGQHMVERVRQLFAGALGYRVPDTPPDYGIVADPEALPGPLAEFAMGPTILLIHASSWESKGGSLEYWGDVARTLIERGYRVLIPWGNAAQKLDAEWIAFGQEGAKVLPQMNLRQLAAVIGAAAGVVTIDTGLGHLAVALGAPTVALYGPTSPGLTGLYGGISTNLASDHLPCIPCLARHCKLLERQEVATPYPPCFQPLTPELVVRELATQMQRVMAEPGDAPEHTA